MVSSIDWHCHLLPGMDDGAVDIDQSLLMAKTLADAGFSEICCTPHYLKGTWGTKAAAVASATCRLQEELDRAGIPLKLHPGMEYYLDEYLLDALEDPLLLPGNKLLVELPSRGDRYLTLRILSQIVQQGHTPLIAHPERCPLLEKTPEESGKKSFLRSLLNSKSSDPDYQPSKFLNNLLDLGCQLQGNFGSFTGFYGERVKRAAANILRSGLYDCFGSDAHNNMQLSVVLKRGMEKTNSSPWKTVEICN